jgi:hypothetical protein
VVVDSWFGCQGDAVDERAEGVSMCVGLVDDACVPVWIDCDGVGVAVLGGGG